MYFGLVHQGQFHQLVINNESLEFYENLKPRISRQPLQLKFSDEDEGMLVLVKDEITGEGSKPKVSERWVKLKEQEISHLLAPDSSISSEFVLGRVGGSVNWSDNQH